MSYDLHLLRPRPGESLEEAAMRDGEEDSRTSPPDPQKEALKRKVADALVAYDAKLEIFKFDYAEIARLQKISADQARQQFRHIELNDEEAGIQIILGDDGAGVSIPSWHSGEKAQSALRRMLAYAQIICRETGMQAYDPQVGEAVDLSDLDKIVPVYVGQVRYVDTLRADAKKPSRPWWKFW